MAPKKTKRSHKRAKRSEKERNCRRRLSGFLQCMGFQCPTTDATTLREEAKCKLKEIKKRKLTHQESTSPKSVACEINMFECDDDESITTSSINSMDSIQAEAPSISRFNHCGGKCRKVKRYIEKIKGSKMVELVCEKKLTASDVNPAQCRLLMPVKQLYRKKILERIEKLERVRLYVPSRLQHYDVCLTKWNMSTNENYVLKSGWIKVVKENELVKSMVVQLWCFQVGDLPSLLLLVDSDGNGDTCGCKCIVSSDEGESTRGVCNDDDYDDEIFGSRRTGGVIIREPKTVGLPSKSESSGDCDVGRIGWRAMDVDVGTSGCNGCVEDERGDACEDQVEKVERSRKGKEKMHEF